MNRKTDNILNDIINDHKKKRTSTSARKCEESDHDDMGQNGHTTLFSNLPLFVI